MHHMRGIGFICLAVLSGIILCLTDQQAFADKRVALVIGNSLYQHVGRLDNPGNDARLIADTLGNLGFTIVGGHALLDVDKATLDTAISKFGSEMIGADVALFFYSGHGVQVRGENYLVPIEANPSREADVYVQMTDVAAVLSQMEGSSTRLNLVILDACRNNPFAGRGFRAVESGLAQMRAPDGTLISYATQPGSVAQDGSDGHSPYTRALAATVQRGGLDVFQTFNEVGLAVKRATSGQQQPWVSNSPIAGSFYFNGHSSPTVSTPQPQAPPQPQAGDEIAWEYVKDSRSIDQIRKFTAEFPSSAHRQAADARIAMLSEPPPRPAQSEPPPRIEPPVVRRPPPSPALLEMASASRWCTPNRSYSLTVNGGSIRWTDSFGSVDVERILENESSYARTVTQMSRHSDGDSVPTGTTWTYSSSGGGRISVSKEGGRPFSLKRC
jgi:uncharacterized caspase-like protein